MHLVHRSTRPPIVAVRLRVMPVGTNVAAVANAPVGPDGIDAPSVFTAVRDQLGFTLQPDTTDVQVVIVGHLERPTEK
jgi:uncharacterized protein (TIGR03435 family)